MFFDQSKFGWYENDFEMGRSRLGAHNLVSARGNRAPAQSQHRLFSFSNAELEPISLKDNDENQSTEVDKFENKKSRHR